jgi:hypothetical protein
MRGEATLRPVNRGVKTNGPIVALTAPKPYGTIGLMEKHRIRLDDYELQLIVSSLWARRRGVSSERALELERLAERLAEGKRGNPNWIFQWAQIDAERELRRGRK